MGLFPAPFRLRPSDHTEYNSEAESSQDDASNQSTGSADVSHYGSEVSGDSSKIDHDILRFVVPRTLS